MKSLAAALVLRVVAVAATTNTDAVQPKYPVNGTVTPCYQNASLSKLPFCNPGLNPMTRAKDLVSRMTKSELMRQLSNGGENSVPRLGLDLYQYHSEGLHGVRTACLDMPDVSTTEFPQVVALAATGNVSLIKEIASVTGDEGRALNNLANGTVYAKGAGLNYWSPTMNVGRDPRWGRFQESISECPVLNALYVSAALRGLQGGHPKYLKLAACCKHFYAYSLEASDGWTRHTFDAIVSKRDLAETYLPVFQTCAAEGVAQVMCSYNSVNGVPTCLDSNAQNLILRETFGFSGMIVSDCDAIADAWEPDSHGYSANASDATATAIMAGTDMDCGITYTAGVEDALSSGALPIRALETAVARSIEMRIKLGEFDKPEDVPYRDTDMYGRATLDSSSSRALALQAAEESIVLLRNKDSLLPLSPDVNAQLRIGILGPTAAPRWNPDDKEDYCSSFHIDAVAGLEAEASGVGGEITVLHCDDCCAEQTTHSVPAKCDLKKAELFAKTVDVVIVALGGDLGGEGRDWAATLPTDQAELASTVVAANAKSIAVLIHGNPMSIDALLSFPAIVEAFEGGQSAGTALARMLLGRSDRAPSGVLPFTIYRDTYTSKLNMSDMSMRAGPGRTYRFLKSKPTFAFGFGLTYTTFALTWHSVPSFKTVTVARAEEGLSFAVKVLNTGNRVGAKVVAAYVSAIATGVADVPRKQLLGMGKILLAPGESGVVGIESNAVPGFCTLCVVDESGESKIRPGTLVVSIGDGGDSASLVTRIQVLA